MDNIDKKNFLNDILGNSLPGNIHQTLMSLWWDKKGNWDRAHSIAQNISSQEGSAIHAYLHRKEGVMWNADYWYKRAGRNRPLSSLDEEWNDLLTEMLEKYA